MKALSSLCIIIPTLTFTFISSIFQQAIAKPFPKDDGCYIVNSSGKVISLSSLCGSPNSITNNNPTQNSKQIRQLPNGVFQAKIKRRDNGIPVIDVKFGNRIFEMIVDTGASGTIITTDMAQALGIVPVAKTLVNTVGANNVELPLGYVPRIEVEGIVAQNVLVGIIPALQIGLLGHDFFGDFEMTVKRDTIEFRSPK
ncbi:putative aspartyl protease [Synechococcus sp. PCC 7502]|uniref:retropepsin-like aspartic protease family protein n=1 Tax=Synechococcus sp. PCC 7502 TaxID=1173263 RepID=UPI00029F966E|nr:retropepsin-like aspartic protease [Synechococcus sp. PCC 7502]AFY75207.1 putative aspartyl protease [Synechococcus sp. PCC 7502]